MSTCDDQKHVWHHLDAVNILLQVASYTWSSIGTVFNARFTLAFLLDDSQLMSLVEIRSILESNLRFMRLASAHYKDDNLVRISIQIEVSGTSLEMDIHHVDRGDGMSISVKEILECLFRLSLNDALKEEIYFSEEVKD